MIKLVDGADRWASQPWPPQCRCDLETYSAVALIAGSVYQWKSQLVSSQERREMLGWIVTGD